VFDAICVEVSEPPAHLIHAMVILAPGADDVTYERLEVVALTKRPGNLSFLLFARDS